MCKHTEEEFIRYDMKGAETESKRKKTNQIFIHTIYRRLCFFSLILFNIELTALYSKINFLIIKKDEKTWWLNQVQWQHHAQVRRNFAYEKKERDGKDKISVKIVKF